MHRRHRRWRCRCPASTSAAPPRHPSRCRRRHASPHPTDTGEGRGGWIRRGGEGSVVAGGGGADVVAVSSLSSTSPPPPLPCRHHRRDHPTACLSRGKIAAAVIIASSSSPRPLSLRCPPLAFVVAMVGGGAMDGGTVATATPSHSHHLESPLCRAPPSHLPPNVDCRVLPPPPALTPTP